jgi:hypothetical protein
MLRTSRYGLVVCVCSLFVVYSAIQILHELIETYQVSWVYKLPRWAYLDKTDPA